MVKYFFLFFLVTIFSCKKDKPIIDEYEDLESIKKSISQFNSKPYDSIKREKKIDQTLKLIDDIDNDSLRNEALFSISWYFLKNEDSLHFIQTNQKTLSLSQQLRDTSKIAESYWDLAHFHDNHGRYGNSEASFLNYSKAQRFYALEGMELESGRMMLRMAIIQKNKKDYTGSEINTINAIRIFEPLKEKEYLYGCYNTLGIIYNELQEYDKALLYHQKANEYQKELETESTYKEKTLNNVGVIYQNIGKYSDAIDNFREALQNNSLSEKEPHLYAMLLDNLAYSKMLAKDTVGIYNEFSEGLRIREEIQHKAGIAVNKIHLAEYFALKGDSVASNKLAQEAYFVSKESGSNTEVLRSLLLLSELNKDGSKEFLGKYISLNDSLQKEERAIRNKFARIRFETDEFIAKNDELNIQKRWMVFGFSGLILLLVSVFTNRNQRIKNRELKLVQQQQDLNEDIYNLLIESQIKIEEGQEREKKRISKELHDGILSQFFGVRLNLETLEGQTDPASMEKRTNYHNELKLLENEIRKVSHQLSSDLLSSEKSFVNIIEDLLRQQEKIGGFKGNLIVKKDIEWEKFSPKVKISFYRIIQEALHNINKHASAGKVAVVLSKNEREILLSITDNGKGFKTRSVSDGIGITNMKSRVLDLKGSISFNSGNEGTHIIIKIPFHSNLSDA